MRTFIFLSLLFLFNKVCVSQNTGIGTTSPHPSAALEINDTMRGFLPPRMTFAQRQSIANPAAGLIIWCTNCDSSGQAQVYNGVKWTNMIGGVASLPITPPLTVGSRYGGGKIIYVFQAGDPGYIAGETHGYIIPEAAITTTAANLNWGTLFSPYGCSGTNVGNTSTIFGSGATNTSRIVSVCTSGNNAAYLCDTLSIQGYSDWFLPSRDELTKVYQNYTQVGGVYPTASQGVWSSSETNSTSAIVCSFDGGGNMISLSKIHGFYLKPLRKF